jgi:hypothetical protein
MVTFVLKGPHEGKTIKLGQYRFVGGKFTTKVNEKELTPLSNLMRYWQAYPEGSPELKKEEENGTGEDLAGQGADQDSVGEHGSPAAQEPAGQGHAGAEAGSPGLQGADAGGREEAPVEDDRLKHILLNLDPEDDEHWTMAGLPRLSTIEEAFGSTGMNRIDIQTALPGWDRDAARAHAKELAEI